VAIALAGLPYLSRPMHRIVGAALILAAVSAIMGGHGLPRDKVLRSLDLFGTEVLPRIRDL
jgi:hypothetical protein